jgi:hypothetical protein
LIDLLEDEELSWEESPGGGWAPVHAVELLGELGATEAIEPMLRQLVESDWESYLHDRLLVTLPKLGAGVAEPALAAHEAATDPEVRGSLCSVLAELGMRDERIYQALVEDFQRDPVLGAMHFAEYGDRRALPLLLAELDQYEPVEEGGPLANFGVADMVDAVEELGGKLTPELQAKVDGIFARDEIRRQRINAAFQRESGRRAPAAPLAGRKVGRNDPCPCGSGKKYKKCCLGKAEG